MADNTARARMQRLPPEVTRVLYVRNLPFKLSSEEMYDIFGKFGPIRQVGVEQCCGGLGCGSVVVGLGWMDVFGGCGGRVRSCRHSAAGGGHGWTHGPICRPCVLCP
jgi:RNA recognition motif-containing protein